jgi:hypothetical protein
MLSHWCRRSAVGRLVRWALLCGALASAAGSACAEPKAVKPQKRETVTAGLNQQAPAAPSGPFVAGKPAASTQVSKSVAERGGVNPCATEDPGFGAYGGWRRDIAMGQLLIPERKGFARRGGFDVMLHFHGHEPARKEWVKVMDGAVLVGITLGVGSGAYETTFASPDAFNALMSSVESAISKQLGRKAVARRIGLSAWSAGYGALQRILERDVTRRRIDTVILLDGLHAGYSGTTLNAAQLRPFVDFAKLSAAGQKLMFVSHSSIIPPGYASTTETANFLIHSVGGKPKASRGRGPLGLELIDRFTRGNFHVRGFSGNDKLDHCAHLGLFADVLEVHVKPRWSR